MANHSFRRLAAGTGAALLLAGCQTGNQPTISTSGKIYSTISSVAADSDLVAKGRIASLVAKAVDDGGNASARVAVPSVVYKLEIAEANPSRSGEINVLWPDLDKVKIEGYVPLKVGGEYVFFLDEVARGERGGLQEFDSLFVPIGDAAGAFTVTGERAQSLGTSLKSISDGGPALELADGHAVTTAGKLIAQNVGGAKG